MNFIVKKMTSANMVSVRSQSFKNKIQVPGNFFTWHKIFRPPSSRIVLASCYLLVKPLENGAQPALTISAELPDFTSADREWIDKIDGAALTVEDLY